MGRPKGSRNKRAQAKAKSKIKRRKKLASSKDTLSPLQKARIALQQKRDAAQSRISGSVVTKKKAKKKSVTKEKADHPKRAVAKKLTPIRKTSSSGYSFVVSVGGDLSGFDTKSAVEDYIREQVLGGANWKSIQVFNQTDIDLKVGL